VGPHTLTIFSIATVGDGTSLTGTAVTFNATEGAAFSGTVATFTDVNAFDAPAGYTASINWNDGTTTSGTITGGNGAFTVSGSHAYSEDGTFDVTVTVQDVVPTTLTFDGPLPSTTLDSTANVAEASLTLGRSTLAANEVTSLVAATVATISDSNPLEQTGNYSVSVDWGDGSPVDAINGLGSTSPNLSVVAGAAAGSFNIRGTHTFRDDGTYSITVSVIDDPAFEGSSPPPR
jgi:hypothetical protein